MGGCTPIPKKLSPASIRIAFEKLSAQEIDLRLKGLYSESEEIEEITPAISEEIFATSPLSTKLYLELPKPTLEDNISDLERLYREIRRINDIPIIIPKVVSRVLTFLFLNPSVINFIYCFNILTFQCFSCF